MTSFSKTSELSDWQHIPGDPAVGVPDRYVAYYEDIPGGESYMLVVSPATSADADVTGEAGAWYWSVEKGKFGILVLDGLTDTMDAAKRKAESVARNESSGFYASRTAQFGPSYSRTPDDILSTYDVDWGYEIDIDGEGGPSDYFEQARGDLVVFIYDPDTQEILDSVGGVEVNYMVSDHGNIIPDASGEAYLLEIARELAQEYTGRTASKVANELVGYPGDDMEDEEMPEVEEIPIAGMARRNPILPAQGRVTDWRNRSNR